MHILNKGYLANVCIIVLNRILRPILDIHCTINKRRDNFKYRHNKM